MANYQATTIRQWRSVASFQYLDVRSAHTHGQGLYKDGAILGRRFGDVVYPHGLRISRLGGECRIQTPLNYGFYFHPTRQLRDRGLRLGSGGAARLLTGSVEVVYFLGGDEFWSTIFTRTRF